MTAHLSVEGGLPAEGYRQLRDRPSEGRLASVPGVPASRMVAAAMAPEARTFRAEDDLETVTRAMLERDVDCAPVVDAEGRLVGVITPRDICAAMCALERLLVDLTVEQAMRDDVVAVGPEQSLARAERLMQAGRLRDVPVVDRKRRVVGLLGIDALL